MKPTELSETEFYEILFLFPWFYKDKILILFFLYFQALFAIFYQDIV